ncbi:MAG: AAA family ATPase [Gammaproteobacteria bacterium]|nr:AAA family ATPase [Gammaproteobacteria bacterium]
MFEKEELSMDDLEDLYALLKSEHGLEDPKDRKANRLRADQIPASVAANVQVKLLAMKDLRNVNAIAPDQRLSFLPQGLTVIYGDNGSGKSGYSRVLKRACRARDQNEPIHPNAFLLPEETGNAEATFEVDINGSLEEVIWEDGKVAPETLSALAVFDSRCARNYLDSEGDYAYVPYGLDILEGLANICKKLKEKIDAEYVQSTVDNTAYRDLEGETAVGQLIAGLSEKTEPERVIALATMTEAEDARYTELKDSLKEENPKDRAVQLRLRARRIAKVVSKIGEKQSIVDDAALEKLRGLADANDSAQRAALLASQAFEDEEGLLPGTGGRVWKELFEAARRYAVEAYPDKTFPNLGPDSQCLLCQQPLKEGAVRLLRFEEFVQKETEKKAEANRKALADGCEAFAGQSMSLGADDELYAELAALDTELAESVRQFGLGLNNRHTAIKKAVNTKKWDQVDALPTSPVVRLQSLVDGLNTEADTLDKIAEETGRISAEKEFAELRTRVQLARVKGAVLTAIEQLGRRVKLKKCQSAVKTNAISNKTRELTQEVVSKDLETALNREFQGLGAGNLQVCLKSRTDKGKAFHKLKLNLPQAKNPGEILSEGEQRAIAIGSFLAEATIGDSPIGLIFDDPVSSLDHKHRERVARRLAHEATSRQVIVFTHDLYFLNLLIYEAEEAKVPVEKQSLQRRPEGFGVTNPDLPFEGMNTKARVGYLRNEQQAIKKTYESGDELGHRKQTVDAYRQLRIAWERGIEEVLLRSVVLRFRKGVETQRLAGVVVEDSDYATVNQWMKKCSDYAHDQALLGGVEVPNPSELLADINALDEWRKQVEQRGVATQRQRKVAGSVQATANPNI